MSLSPIAALAVAAVLAAQSATPLTGAWTFQTDARGPDGQPVCTETWTFEGDRLIVQSAEERVEKTWRLQADGAGQSLITEMVSTNGRPDCQGHVTTTVTPGERSTFLMFNNGGTAVVCGPPARMADGAMFVGPTCYGSLRPAA